MLQPIDYVGGQGQNRTADTGIFSPLDEIAQLFE